MLALELSRYFAGAVFPCRERGGRESKCDCDDQQFRGCAHQTKRLTVIDRARWSR